MSLGARSLSVTGVEAVVIYRSEMQRRGRTPGAENDKRIEEMKDELYRERKRFKSYRMRWVRYMEHLGSLGGDGCYYRRRAVVV